MMSKTEKYKKEKKAIEDFFDNLLSSENKDYMDIFDSQYDVVSYIFKNGYELGEKSGENKAYFDGVVNTLYFIYFSFLKKKEELEKKKEQLDFNAELDFNSAIEFVEKIKTKANKLKKPSIEEVNSKIL